jgi:hypothetical protein
MAAKYIIFKETIDRDLAIENGSFVLIEDAEAVAQNLASVLREAKNDWFLDLDRGLNYVGDDDSILGADSLSLENETRIIELINNHFGVRELTSLETEFLSQTNFKITAVVITEFAEEPITVSIGL